MGKEALTKNQLELITSVAGQEAIKQFQAQEKKKKKHEQDWRLRNVTLLLDNYRRLKKHCESIENEVEEKEVGGIIVEELTIDSLLKYRIKTANMMKHFDRMLKHYESDCMNGTEEEYRRYKVIKNRFLNEQRLPVQKIAELFYVDEKSIYRDIKIAKEELSVLLFGITALELAN